MESKVAIVKDTFENIYKGQFKAYEIGTKEPYNVIMTTPFGSHPLGSRYSRYSGLYGMPTEGTEIIIKKVSGSSYWYFDSVVSVSCKSTKENPNLPSVEDKPYAGGSRVSLGESMEDFTHQPNSQMIGMMSPEGHSLKLADSSNPAYRSLYTALTSKVGQQLGLFVSEGMSVLKNSTKDGIMLTDRDTKSLYGDRTYKNEVKGNLFNTTTNGQMRLTVGAGGRTLDIQNKAGRDWNNADIPSDNDNGSINISSRSNDITVKVYREDGGRIFIDASEANGIVCIKAGEAGVEVYTKGDMHFLSEGSMNFRAGKDITIKSGSNIYLNPDNEVPKPTLADFTKDNAQLAEESLE